MDTVKTPVLVIGGGPVGLSTALHLDRQGIDCILIEKHATTAFHPKASYFNVRTLEILRILGIADEIYATALMPAGTAFYTKLCGYKLGVFSAMDYPEHINAVMQSTATPGCVSSQVVLEEILHRHASAAAHVDVRFGHEKTKIEQDEIAVRTTVLNRNSGETFTIEADYVVACEGVRSSTRDELGAKLLGPPPFGHAINIYIEADLESLVDERDMALFWTATPTAPGAFIALGGGHRRYCFNTPYHPERGEKPEDFDETRAMERVRAAIGNDSLPIKILSIGSWVLCGQVVDEYRKGRVFFGGDTAHLNIPTGGFGFNTGMQETHNLAWKLAAVLRGDAPEALLDTYHSERRPIADFNVEQSRENAVNIRDTGATFGGTIPDNDEIDLDTPKGKAQRKAKARAIVKQTKHFVFLGQEIGFGYWDSPLITPDGTPHYAVEHGVENSVSTYIPNARPGARAPHCWFDAGAADRTAAHDLFDDGFVLLTHGADGARWASALPGSGPVASVGVKRYSVGEEGSGADLVDLGGSWRRDYGFADTPDGAVLVRPDGHVAWRSFSAPDDTAAAELEEAALRSLGHRLE